MRGDDARPDLVERNAGAPDQLWVPDITCVPTGGDFLYLAVVMEAFSRRIVGWSMAGYLRTGLVLAALDMTVAQGEAAGIIHYSDWGSQYTSVVFRQRCREAGICPSTGSPGDCYDNVMRESFFVTLECALIKHRRFATKAARMAVFSFIERQHLTAAAYSSPQLSTDKT